MVHFHIRVVTLSLVSLLCAISCPGQQSRAAARKAASNKMVRPKTPADRKAELNAAAMVKDISKKYRASVPYVIQGDIDIGRQSGDDPREMLAKSRIQFTAAPGGKYRLHSENAEKAPGETFDLISDGRKRWLYVPARHEYTETEARPIQSPGLAMTALEDGRKPEPRDIIGEFSLELMPALAGLADTVEVSFLRGPVLTVVSKKGAQDSQTLFYLNMDTEGKAISKLAWTKAFPYKDRKILIRYDFNCERLGPAATAAGETFTFVPPADAKLVDSLPSGLESAEPASEPKAEAPPAK